MAAVTTAAALAGCGSSAHGATAQPIATVNQRYTAAVDPANAALATVLKQALTYTGGPTTDLDAAASPTATTLAHAARQVDAIGAPGPLGRDIHDVASALTAVAGDMTALRTARGPDVLPGIARLVADAGREAAADNLVRLYIVQLTTPTTTLPPNLEPPSTTPSPLAPSTTAASRHTTATRPRTTTTRRSTTSTSKP